MSTNFKNKFHYNAHPIIHMYVFFSFFAHKYIWISHGYTHTCSQCGKWVFHINLLFLIITIIIIIISCREIRLLVMKALKRQLMGTATDIRETQGKNHTYAYEVYWNIKEKMVSIIYYIYECVSAFQFKTLEFFMALKQRSSWESMFLWHIYNRIYLLLLLFQ